QLAVRGQAFNGRDLGAVLHDGKGQARDDAPAVDENGAGPALAVVAAFLGSGEIKIFAKCVEQSGPWPKGNAPLDAVDAKRDVALRWRRKLAPVLTLITQRHPDLPLANANMQNHANRTGVPAEVTSPRADYGKAHVRHHGRRGIRRLSKVARPAEADRAMAA